MNPPAGSVRRRGLVKLFVGLLIFIPIVLVLVFLTQQSNVLVPIGLTLPGVYALAGLVEFVTGVSFLELATRWDNLKGWQRGVFGTFIVVTAMFVIILGVALFAAHQ